MDQRRGSIGRRRLRIVLAVLGFAGCPTAMVLVVAFYGAPYTPAWWWVMAAVRAAATVIPPLLAPAIEWVLDGYRQDSRV